MVPDAMPDPEGWIKIARPSRRPLSQAPQDEAIFLNAIKPIPHAEARPKGASRSTQDARAASNSEGLAQTALAGRRHADRPRAIGAANPAECQATRRQRCAERAADMQPPLAPIEAGAAEDAAARTCGGAEIDPEIAQK